MGGQKNPKLYPPKEKKVRRAKRGRPPVVNWEDVKIDYIAQNLDPERDTKYTLKECSVRWDVSYKAIRDHSGRENWRDELRDQVKKRTAGAIDRSRAKYEEVEMEIRNRHAQVAKGLLVKAILRANAITDPATEMSIDQMLKFMQLAMSEEREARGLPKVFAVQTQDALDVDGEYETPQSRLARKKMARRMHKQLSELFGTDDEDDAPVDPEEVEADEDAEQASA